MLSTALMTLMVNARHLFYGISMIDRYKEAGAKKPYLVFALTDETYSLVCSGDVPEGVDKNWYFFFVSLFNQGYWIAGSIAGSLIGSLLTFNTEGIEFSMTALFIVVFIEQWKGTSNHLGALIGVGASLACLLIFGAEGFLIPSMFTITIALTALRRRMEVHMQDAKERGSDENA